MNVPMEPAEAAAEPNRGPLSGLRVLELGQLIAGPFCGQLFADFGAEVIKVEPPGAGDPMREWGRERPMGRSLWFPVIARGKKSITLDLRQAAAQDVLRKLVAKSDILIENFRPGTMERWGLGYDALSQINPKLIMVRVSGYGQTGPYSTRAGYGSIGEAMGGMRYVVGDPSLPPSRVGFSIGDTLAALFGCLGAVIALQARKTTGRGQIVDSAIYEAVLGVTENLVTEYARAGYVRERSGAVLPNIAPSNVYPTADGVDILIAANQDSVFKRLCAAMGKPELASDARYATHVARGERQEALDSEISAWTATIASGALEALLNEHGVPSGRIYTAADMLRDAHFAARKALVQVTDPVLGELTMQNVFPVLSETPGRVTAAAPELGASNREVFAGLLALGEEELRRMEATGSIGPLGRPELSVAAAS